MVVITKSNPLAPAVVHRIVSELVNIDTGNGLLPNGTKP